MHELTLDQRPHYHVFHICPRYLFLSGSYKLALQDAETAVVLDSKSPVGFRSETGHTLYSHKLNIALHIFKINFWTTISVMHAF